MEKTKKTLTKQIFHKFIEIVGIIFILLGIIGFFLPILPTFPFLIVGILILGEESIYTGWIFKILPPKARDLLRRKIESLRTWLKKKFKKSENETPK